MIHHMVAVSREKAISLGIKSFVKSSACKNGHYSYFLVCNYTCIECAKLIGKKSRFKNVEKTRKKDRDRYHSLPDAKKLDRNKKLYAASDKESAKERHLVWRSKNKDKLSAYSKKYKNENRDALNKAERDRRKNDPEFKCLRLCRDILRRTLASTGSKKNNRTFSLIGYTHDELKAHIERQFTKGMCWSKVGSEIEIDHIYPLSKMIKEGVKDPAIINALSNLIPRWKDENRKKGSKVESLL